MPSPSIHHSSFVKSLCQISSLLHHQQGFLTSFSASIVPVVFSVIPFTLKYRQPLIHNMADDAVLLILSNHGERLTSIESDVHDIRTGIEQIKDSPIFAIERYVRRKVAQTGGVIGLVLIGLMALMQ
jgi:hypothetical protein